MTSHCIYEILGLSSALEKHELAYWKNNMVSSVLRPAIYRYVDLKYLKMQESLKKKKNGWRNGLLYNG